MSDNKFSFGDYVSFFWQERIENPKIVGIVANLRKCDCGEWEYQIKLPPNDLYDDLGWAHEKYLISVDMREWNKKYMSDSLENSVKVINYFEELKKINPTLYGLFERCIEKIVIKNHDYAGKEDFYRNFRKSENVDIPAWKGIFVRFQDKVSRIEGFIKTGILLVTDESIIDTCIDAANYILLMLACYLDDMKPKKIVDQRDAP